MLHNVPRPHRKLLTGQTRMASKTLDDYFPKQRSKTPAKSLAKSNKAPKRKDDPCVSKLGQFRGRISSRLAVASVQYKLQFSSNLDSGSLDAGLEVLRAFDHEPSYGPAIGKHLTPHNLCFN